MNGGSWRGAGRRVVAASAVIMLGGAVVALVWWRSPAPTGGRSSATDPVVIDNSSGGGGAWGTAIEVPGIAALNTGGDAHITPVSCTSAGNCSAGGIYTDRSRNIQVFVVSEH